MTDSTTPSSYEPPVPLCLLIADTVYQDRETGKNIIAGTYNAITVQQLPFQHPGISIFFQVTNVTRPADLRLCVEYAKSGELIFDLGGPVSSPNPMEVVARGVRLSGLPFQEAGKYWVQLRSEEAILIQAPLYVSVAKKPRRREA